LSVTATATADVAPRDAPDGPATPDGRSFVDSLVTRLHSEYGVDRDELRRLAGRALETFATAPVQTFVPILVEKSVRDACRRLRSADRIPTPRRGLDDGVGRPGAGRSW
jgi:hypothetical protein